MQLVLPSSRDPCVSRYSRERRPSTPAHAATRVTWFFFLRFRRATHVTPKSYLNFIAGYKNIYQGKQRQLAEGARRMDTGLAKLEEASVSVESLKQDLAEMEQELQQASEKAERVSSSASGFPSLKLRFET